MDVTKPSDIPGVEMQPIKPERVEVHKPDPPHVDISVREAIGLWWKWWWRNKAADAMAGLPADLLPPVAAVHKVFKMGLIVLAIVIIGGILAWIIFR